MYICTEWSSHTECNIDNIEAMQKAIRLERNLLDKQCYNNATTVKSASVGQKKVDV